jgi:RNA polymerase sigma-70 factor (ECF subfamily)
MLRVAAPPPNQRPSGPNEAGKPETRARPAKRSEQPAEATHGRPNRRMRSIIDDSGPEGSLVSENELSAFSRIYETYHDRVLAYAAKLIGRDHADDVTQEVFIKIGRSLEGLADPSKLASWVYAITLNTVRDLARKHSSLKERQTSCGGLGHGEGGEDDLLARVPDTRSTTAEEAAMRDEMLACYLDYVEALPANYFDVYMLSDFYELSNEEIARQLSLTIGTVKIRLHRARTKLYEQFRRDCQCFVGERGDLMARPKEGLPKRKPTGGAKRPPRRAAS